MPSNSYNLTRLFNGRNISQKHQTHSGGFIYSNVNNQSKKSHTGSNLFNCGVNSSSINVCKKQKPSCSCCFGSPTCPPTGDCVGSLSTCCANGFVAFKSIGCPTD